jgi:hypothetical protein
MAACSNNAVPLMISEIGSEIVDELQGSFSLRLGDAHNVQANEAERLRCYANVLPLMRRVEVEARKVGIFIQVGLPFKRAVDANLVEWDSKSMVHERVLEKATDERPFPVIFSDEPAAVRS